MQIEQVLTFLEILSTRSFSAAAVRLNVTQSTVSARIKALEEALGQPLFRRAAGGIELTPAGQRFQRHAETIQRGWSDARQAVALPKGYHQLFRLGGPVGYWDRLIARWVPWMQRRAPGVALRLEGNYSASLSDQIADGHLDLGILYLPQQRPGLAIEPLLEEELVLVSGTRRVADWQSRFVMVDWGEEHRARLADAFPELPPPAVSVGLGSLGLAFILEQGASGYLPAIAVRQHLAEGRLRRVPGAPAFPQSVFVAHPRRPPDREVLDLAIRGLKRVLMPEPSAMPAPPRRRKGAVKAGAT